MAYPVLSVASRILQLAKERGKALDPLQLQKLVYLSHGWNLSFTGKPLINEKFDAWKYGPVCYPLYTQFNKYRADAITEIPPSPPLDFTPKDEKLFSEILRVYGDKSGVELSSLTHEADSAWRAVYDGSTLSSPTIPNYLIKTEFDLRRKNA